MSFTYEDGKAPVMSHVSFKAQPGEILAFVGPSGGGKTTMLRLMLGLLRPQDGTLTVRLEDGSSELPVSDSTRRLCAIFLRLRRKRPTGRSAPRWKRRTRGNSSQSRRKDWIPCWVSAA